MLAKAFAQELFKVRASFFVRRNDSVALLVNLFGTAKQMTRVFLALGIDDLTARSRSHPEDIPLIVEELNHRRSRAAARLKNSLTHSRMSDAQEPLGTSASSFARSERTNQTRDRARPENWATLFDFAATSEQEEIVDLFLSRQSMKVSAFAGTGKTSTLKFLAATAPEEKGLYLAFNKAIAVEANDTFGPNVKCLTTHALALQQVRSSYGNSHAKLFGAVNARKLVEMWNIERAEFGSLAIKPDMVAHLILRAVTRYEQSGDTELDIRHVELAGKTLGLSEANRTKLSSTIAAQAKVLWSQKVDINHDMPLGFDGFLKVWSLSEPRLPYDYILLDEAQDTNPAVLSVLERQSCQIVYVGDRHQQIYEWRGAENAMATVSNVAEAHLTQSFRFGSAIASEASRILNALGEDQPLVGLTAISSTVLSVGHAKTILTRTNAMLFREVMTAIDEGRAPLIVGGTKQMKALLSDVYKLKEGKPGSQPEFFGFYNWQEVIEFVQGPEGESLLAFVNLVEQVGVSALWRAIGLCVEEEHDADLILSTAHKAKGCEWDSVRIAEDFSFSQSETGQIPFSEARLFYVAITRAKQRLVVDPVIMSAFASNLAPDHVLRRMQSSALDKAPPTITDDDEGSAVMLDLNETDHPPDQSPEAPVQKATHSEYWASDAPRSNSKRKRFMGIF